MTTRDKLNLVHINSGAFALPNAEIDTPLNRASSRWTVRYAEEMGCFIVEDEQIGLIGYVSLELDVAKQVGLDRPQTLELNPNRSDSTVI